MADAAKWYVVHTYSGYENKVASSIEKAVENRRLHDLITAVNIWCATRAAVPVFWVRTSRAAPSRSR